jgi:hypothetical protein
MRLAISQTDRPLDIRVQTGNRSCMKLRKGLLPLIIFALAATAFAAYTFLGRDRAPMEDGRSIFDQP